MESYNQSMHEISPPIEGKGGLYLGNIQAARKLQQLDQKGIGCVITIIDHKFDNLVPERIQHLYISAEDHESQDLKQYFEKTNLFIEENLKNTNVLVHCMAGVSRSATIVIAFLMNRNRWNFQKTFTLVREIRLIVGPNDGFVDQLKQYQTDLQIEQ